MKEVRYGIVGYGKQGSLYAFFLTKLKFILRGSKLTAIAEKDENKRNIIKDKYKDVVVFEDYKEMFKSNLIDVVLVVTPHYFHPEICIEAMKHNINVLCDKPIGVYTKQVRPVLDEIDKHKDLTFGMMFNQRTNPLFIKAKSLIDSGRLGSIKRACWIITDWYRPDAYYNQGGWRGTWWGEGGGVLLNQCPHQLDIFTWLLGVPLSVNAIVKTVERKISVENDVTCICNLKNGGTAVLITSTHDTPGTDRLEITGDNGKIIITLNKTVTNDDIGKLEFFENVVPESVFAKENKKFWGKPKYKKHVYKGTFYKMNFLKNPPQHMSVLKNYTNYLLGKENKLIAPGKEGINALTLSNAIHLSGWLNKEIAIPYDENLFKAELDKRIEEEKK